MASKPNITVNFLLADLVRQEANRKLTLIGYYAGDEVLLNGDLPEQLPPDVKGIAVQQGLTIVANVSGVSGTLRAHMQLFDPTGEELGKGTDSELEVPTSFHSGGTGSLVYAIVPFPVPTFGTFRAELTIGKEKFSYRFIIRHSDPAAWAPWMKGPNPFVKKSSRTAKKSSKSRRPKK